MNGAFQAPGVAAVAVAPTRAHQAPMLTLNHHQQRVSLKPFTATLAIGAAWMAERGLRSTDVWAAVHNASVSMELGGVAHCRRCARSAEKGRVVCLGALCEGSPDITPEGDCVFHLDKCISSVFPFHIRRLIFCHAVDRLCSSSRIHLGGRVQVSFALVGSSGRAYEAEEAEVRVVRPKPKRACYRVLDTLENSPGPSFEPTAVPSASLARAAVAAVAAATARPRPECVNVLQMVMRQLEQMEEAERRTLDRIGELKRQLVARTEGRLV
eukprot:m51a1_g4636 hypothetical protein (269) ;mRNA; r:333388-334411